MKNRSRLIALLLVLAMSLTSVAFATEGSVPLDGLNTDNYEVMLAGAQDLDKVSDTVLGWGVVNSDAGAQLCSNHFLPGDYVLIQSELLATLEKGTFVTVFEGKYNGAFGGILSGEWYKVDYNGTVGYVQDKYLTLCTCSVEEGQGLDSHADGCPDKLYYITVCSLTAEEIYANWVNYTAEGQAFIQLYLSWTDQVKLAALQVLLTEMPSVETTVNGVAVKMFGSIPENVTAEVEKFAYDYYSDAVEGQLSSYASIVFAYNIALLNDDGSKWQPSNGEKIRIELDASAMRLSEGTRLGVLHEDSDGNVEKLGISVVKDGKLSFETDGFSTFYGYTVDFVFNGSMFKIPGGTTIELAQVFTELGINDWTADQATDVVFSNPELLRPYKDETTGAWMLESLQAFTTEELLTITFDTGEVLSINVYDVTTISGNTNLFGNHAGITVTNDAVVTLTGDVTLTGPVEINEGKTLTIKTNGNYSITYTGTNESIYMFKVPKTSTLVIDGGAYKITLSGNEKKISAVNCIGSLDFDDVIITKFKYRGINIPSNNNNETGVLNGIISLDDCSFTETGSSEDGEMSTGAIMYIVGGSATKVSMTNCTAKKCNSYNGGIRTNGSTVCKLTISGCTFEGNISQKNGGVIYWNANQDFKDGNGLTQLSISGCTFEGNEAYNNDNEDLLEGGGAIFCEANMDLSSSTFTKNYSGGRGGAINLNTYNGVNNGMIVDIKDGVTISENKAKYEGGGISMYIRHTDNTANNSVFAINVVGDILDNTSGTNGGGVYVYDWLKTSHTSTININGGTISGNKAVNGAGVAVEDVDVTLTTGVVQNNIASENGGGIYAISKNRDVVVSLNGGSVKGNKAGNGAGVAVLPSDSKKVTINAAGTSVTENVASAMGGGLYVTGANGTMNVSDGVVGENKALNGGGVYLTDSAKLYVTNGNIDGNEASNGGGIYLTNSAYLEIDGGSISKNKAVGTPDTTVTTAYNTDNVPGVGGGISVVGSASASQKTMIDVYGQPIGVYGNTADFAADDVFASGQGTKLMLPAKADMSINDPDYTATTGWYEDYATGDTEYKTKGLYGNATYGKAERYRTQVEIDQLTVQAFVNESEYTDANTSLGKPAHYTNEEDVYVCITLGVVNLPSGTLKISKVFDAELADVYKDQIFVFTVSGKTANNEDITFKVQTRGTEPVTVAGLPMGKYTGAEEENWAWRFDCESSENITLEEGNTSADVKLQNTLKEDQWLDFDISKANTFETVTETP